MIERLEKVLRKVVLPMSEGILDVEINVLGRNDIYRITYLVKDDVEFELLEDMERETATLFAMLSPKENEKCVVNYKLIEEGLDD